MPQIETIPETGSTNAELVARLHGGAQLAESYWLVADRQTAGRGRLGRSWLDGTGNFMGSTLVRLRSGDPPAASLALVSGLAVFDAVSTFLASPAALRLKWPNDLMLAEAKLAGVLLELCADCVIVGIGVNLATAPSVGDRKTIALSALGAAPDRDTFALRIAFSFEAELDRWRANGLAVLLHRWQTAAHPVGTPLSVQEPGAEPIRGKFAGLAEDGALRLRLADGTVRAIHAGDVIA